MSPKPLVENRYACSALILLGVCLSLCLLPFRERQPEVFWIDDVAPETYRANYPPPLISLPPTTSPIGSSVPIDWGEEDLEGPDCVEVDKLIELIEARSSDEGVRVEYFRGRILVWGTPAERERVHALLACLRQNAARAAARALRPRRGRR